ncbi:DUF4436 family protein [Microbacterium rhizomatis]|uniref:DUF4436 family protein n=1 Tax=Microbacterium rhizomatis TaxID=1631477 RepID=UPI00147901A1|nr:DUF4436 family protein [Microbacterium rhizomatis]
MPPASKSRRFRGRTVVWVVSILALFAVVYVGVVSLYAAGDSLESISASGCAEDAPKDAVVLSFSPQSMDAAGDRLNAIYSVLDFGPVPQDEAGFLKDPLTVIVFPNDGSRSFTVAAGQVPSSQPLRLITDGYIEQWPFDSHSVDVRFLAAQTVNGVLTPIKTVVCGSAHVPGWTFASETVSGSDDLIVNGEALPALRITATRSSATVAFGMVILALMIVMPVLSLTVAILAFRGRRKVEATLMSWMAAVLFATIPLRTFLPGAPPIGSWVDFVVVLWVLAALVTALVIYVIAWVRWTPPAPQALPGPPAPPPT